MLCAGLVLLVLAILLSFGTGPLKVPAGDVMHAIGVQLGLAEPGNLSQRDISVVWNMRIPRALLGALVGASLAMAGASLQGLFGNPLADPGIVGVTNGAALGAVAAIVLGLTAFGAWTVPVSAFIGGALTTSLIYVLARPGRGSGTATLLLVGIAIGAACSAAIGFFTYVANDNELQSLVFWQMGSLASASWSQLASALPAFVVGAIALMLLATPLDMLALGERQAQHIGLDVKRTRAMLVACSALLVGSAVAFAGSVGFVGLVVPHFVRLLAGPGHRWLLPLSAICGALLIVIADTAARTLDPPSEIPLGLFSAALGAPFFLWLVLRQKPGGAH
ncbi:FecCD family ABC transporter permease [Luteimonas sp. RIT-PG2_3]